MGEAQRIVLRCELRTTLSGDLRQNKIEEYQDEIEAYKTMRFAKAVSFTFIIKILKLALSLVTLIIISRILGPKGLGIYTLVILLPALIITFTNLGISRTVVYLIGKQRYSLREVVQTVINFTFLLSIGSILIALFIVTFLSDSIFPMVPRNLLLFGIIAIPASLFLSQCLLALLLSFQLFKEYNLADLINSAAFLISCIIILCLLKLGTIGAILSYLVALYLTTILVWRWVVKEVPCKYALLKMNKPVLRELLNFGIKVNLNTSLSFLHLRIDMLMLNYFLQPLTVGYYAIAVSLGEKLWLLSSSAATVLYPKVATIKQERAKNELSSAVGRIIFFITAVGGCIMYFLSGFLISILFSKSYLQSVKPLQILLIGMVAVSLERIIANDLIARGKPMINTYITSFCVVLNVILNLLLIPKWGVIGASWATSISYSAGLIVKAFMFSKITGVGIREIVIIKPQDIIPIYIRVRSAFLPKLLVKAGKPISKGSI
ncbi:MAG: flippase [Candidatus Hodarchaeota archaeon]